MPSESWRAIYAELARSFRGRALWSELTDRAMFPLMNDHEAEHFIGYVFHRLYEEYVAVPCDTCRGAITKWAPAKNPTVERSGLPSGAVV